MVLGRKSQDTSVTDLLTSRYPFSADTFEGNIHNEMINEMNIFMTLFYAHNYKKKKGHIAPLISVKYKL